MRATYTMMQMSLRNQLKAGRYNELAPRAERGIQFINETVAKLFSHDHKKELPFHC